jgi:hypothetical protein
VDDHVWLEPDDELLLDGADYRVVGRLMGRTDRLSFQRLTVRRELGNDERALLQSASVIQEAQPLPPELLDGREVKVGGRLFHLRWEGTVRTERATIGSTAKFGRGRCAWYAAEDGATAVLIVERYERQAILGVPLDPDRIDMRFTEALRKGGRD